MILHMSTKKLYRRINKSVIINRKKDFITFIGTERYKDSNREADQLTLTNSQFRNSLYELTQGKVAFIPSSEAYPSSFMFIIKMIFNKFDIIDKIYAIKNATQKLTIYLYNKGYLFLNYEDINFNDDNLNKIVNYSKIIIICGESNKAKDFFKDICGNCNKRMIILQHPSAVNIDRKKFNEQWIKHKVIDGYNLKKLIIKKY